MAALFCRVAISATFAAVCASARLMPATPPAAAHGAVERFLRAFHLALRAPTWPRRRAAAERRLALRCLEGPRAPPASATCAWRGRPNTLRVEPPRSQPRPARHLGARLAPRSRAGGTLPLRPGR